MPIFTFLFWVLPGLCAVLYLHRTYGPAFNAWRTRKNIHISPFVKIPSMFILIWVCVILGPMSWIGIFLITQGIKLEKPTT